MGFPSLTAAVGRSVEMDIRLKIAEKLGLCTCYCAQDNGHGVCRTCGKPWPALRERDTDISAAMGLLEGEEVEIFIHKDGRILVRRHIRFEMNKDRVGNLWAEARVGSLKELPFAICQACLGAHDD